MTDFTKISWKVDPNKAPQLFKSMPRNILDNFLKKVNSYIPDVDLQKQMNDFSKEAHILEMAFERSEKVFSTTPLVAAYLQWMKENKYRKEKDLQLNTMLLEEGFIGLKDSEDNIWTLKHASFQGENAIYDAIRCRREWPNLLREELVNTYAQFIFSLNTLTYGYINSSGDLEKEKVRSRIVGHKLFISFLDNLNEKFQLIAKLLYFGGSRTMEEVLQLSLEDVSFKNKHITFNSQIIPYPLHVFADIKALAPSKANGKLFKGRQDSPLNPATIFRNFKEAAIKSGLGPSFSPSQLTTDI